MKLLVLGNPIKHSKSPEIQNYWLKKNNISEKYEKVEITVNQIDEYINKIKTNQLIGFNVTVPFKEKFYKKIKHHEKSALNTKAVNTVYKKDNKVFGANTDGVGFTNSLKLDCKLNLKKKNVLIVGAGGASRGICFEIIKHKIQCLTIMNRTSLNLMKLVKDLRKENIKCKILIKDWSDRVISEETNVVVNTTSLGLKKQDTLEFDFSKANTKCLIYDLIYNPKETHFLKQAKKYNLTTSNGLGMLCRQAAESFNMWFGIKISETQITEILNKLKGSKI